MANPSANVGTHTTLKGVQDIGRAQFKESIESNLVEFFKWGCLGIGAFYNFNFPASGAYGGTFTTLRLSEDPNYTKGQVWEGPRTDWVWESGVQYGTQPIEVSGVYVDGVFYANGAMVPDGGNFHINYPLGRIIFDNPIASTSHVECEYSVRSWQFTPASVPWWREVQYNSMRVDDFQYLQYGSGVWNVLGENRVQLPHVIVDCTPRQSYIPLGLGQGTRVNQEVIFHILGEVPYDTKAMSDIVVSQRDKTIYLFDKNQIADAEAYPLNQDGSIADGAKCYPDLVAPSGDGGYFWVKGTILEMSSDSVSNSPPLYQACVRATVQVDMPW
jgi:hypothetical protein